MPHSISIYRFSIGWNYGNRLANLYQWLSITIPLTCLQYPFLLPICVALALSGLNSSFCLAPCSKLSLFSGSLFWCLFWPLVLPGPTSWPLHASWLLLLPPGPPLWFSLPGLFWPKVRDADECGKEWMGKEDEGSRGMGCNRLCLCLSYHLTLSQAYLVPHTYVNMNCNIINIF